ncbi:SMP-30/gluconolactonase/LRE family protein [Nonomuraea sp. NPDC003560]|uniref:SMP-30/gluconolactonase/LRE family protein n=1 Tax=Nonomuraea sp. NPDC003560 TaxID=3364341 RepID=UPI0036A72E07
MTETKTLVTGLCVGESPRWHEGRLWFSHWGVQEIVAVTPDGEREVVARGPKPAGFCLGRLPDGRLLVTGEHELLRVEPDGTTSVHADLGELPAGPNEVVVDGRGRIYVNCVGFDFGRADFAPGVIALVGPGGEARVVAEDLYFPNGMVVTPDGSTLIVAESWTRRLTAFDIDADGGLSGRRVWAPIGGDGICMDAEGAIWTQVDDEQGSACVRVREGGEVTDRIELDRACFAAALGGPDGRTLFMTVAVFPGVERMAEMFAGRTGEVRTADVAVPGLV